MPSEINRVKQVVAACEAGFRLSQAVSNAIGMTLTDFAESIDRRRVEVSMCLNAHPGRRYQDIREKLAHSLGCDPEFVDSLIERFGRSGA